LDERGRWKWKRQAAETACREKERQSLDVGLRLAETLDAVAGLPLTTFLENIDALKALQNVAFDDETGGALEAFVLRHGG
jgi:hypothetical protein